MPRRNVTLVIVATLLLSGAVDERPADGGSDGGAAPLGITALTHSLDTRPRRVAVAPFDGDAHPDVLVLTSRTTVTESDQLLMLSGQGDGAFAAGFDYEVAPPESPIGVNPAFGDVDGDSDLDILLCNSPYFGNGTRLNDGQGDFNTWMSWNFFGGAATDVVLFDRDGDDDLDVFFVEIDLGPYVCLGEGNGNGLFTALGFNFFSGGDSASQVAAGELNGDDSPDLGVASQGGISLAMTVAGAPVGVAFTEILDGGFRDLAFGDVTGDGLVDVVATSPLTHQVVVIPATAVGVFGAPVWHTVGRRPTMMVLADLDGDTVLDVACTNEGDASVSLLLSDGAGSFEPFAKHAVGRSPLDIAVGDLDGDGDLDLVTSSGLDRTLSVLLNGTVP